MVTLYLYSIVIINQIHSFSIKKFYNDYFLFIWSASPAATASQSQLGTNCDTDYITVSFLHNDNGSHNWWKNPEKWIYINIFIYNKDVKFIILVC